MANPYYGSGPLRARPVGNPDEIQLRIDPMNADLDEEIIGLSRKIGLLKGLMKVSHKLCSVALLSEQEINITAKRELVSFTASSARPLASLPAQHSSIQSGGGNHITNQSGGGSHIT